MPFTLKSICDLKTAQNIKELFFKFQRGVFFRLWTLSCYKYILYVLWNRFDQNKFLRKSPEYVFRKSPKYVSRKSPIYVFEKVSEICIRENLPNLYSRKSPKSVFKKISEICIRENLPKISLFTCTPVGVHTSTTIIIIVGSWSNIEAKETVFLTQVEAHC